MSFTYFILIADGYHKRSSPNRKRICFTDR